jgi:hypothetical protein
VWRKAFLVSHNLSELLKTERADRIIGKIRSLHEQKSHEKRKDGSKEERKKNKEKKDIKKAYRGECV